MSIDQLQVEAGRDGLRAKALEADVLRSVVKEAGGLQALIFQMKTMRVLVDKAGGLQELEQFVLDLRTIRDTLDELKGSQGLVDLAPEVRDLLTMKQNYTELQSEVRGPDGLRTKAAKYEKLMQTFTEVQGDTSIQQSAGSCTSMNPARAQMISATPLETDPDRDLYEAPPPVAKPNNRTGSNNTPLGTAQAQPTLKRKQPESTAASLSAKRPRVDLRRASALVQASLPAVSNKSTMRSAIQSNATETHASIVACKIQAQPNCIKGESTLLGVVGSERGMQTAAAPVKIPDWSRSDARLTNVGIFSTSGLCSDSSTPPNQCTQLQLGATPGPMGFNARGSPFLLPEQSGSGSYPALQPAMTAVLPLDPCYNQLSVWKDYIRHTMAFWVGAPTIPVAWNAYQSYELKKTFQIPGDLLATFAAELSSRIPIAKYSVYEAMMPNHDTCILRCEKHPRWKIPTDDSRYMIDGHRPSGVPQERTACRLCTSHRRPCALLQDIDGVRTIVILPLRPNLRPGEKWYKKAYWVQVTQLKK